MNRRTTLTLTTIALLCAAVVLPVGDAVAQQKQKVSYKVPPQNSKYTQQHLIEVGDVPGHEVRVFELHRTFPNDAPVINGVKLKETWTRSTSDYVDQNGATIGYTVYLLDNGDKFFTKQSTMGSTDATGKRTSITFGTITGGTGKFVGMQGVVRATGAANPKAGVNETQSEIEYWFAK